jgi:hypothetical protein
MVVLWDGEKFPFWNWGVGYTYVQDGLQPKYELLICRMDSSGLMFYFSVNFFRGCPSFRTF